MKKHIMALIKIYYLHREKLLYLFFGGLTTVLGYALYFYFSRMAHMTPTGATNASTAIAILFAYVTNKLFVFRAKTQNTMAWLKEFVSFIAARLLSWGFTVWMVHELVEVRKWNDLLVVAGLNVVVIVMNYLASKWFIFAKKEKG